MSRMIGPRAVSVAMACKKRNNKLCLYKKLSRTFYSSVEQNLDIILQPKHLLNVWSECRSFLIFSVVLLELSIKIFCSRVINLLLTSLARGRTGRISALSLFCTDLAAVSPCCQDLGPMFSQYSPHAWLIRCMYQAGH